MELYLTDYLKKYLEKEVQLTLQYPNKVYFVRGVLKEVGRNCVKLWKTTNGSLTIGKDKYTRKSECETIIRTKFILACDITHICDLEIEPHERH